MHIAAPISTTAMCHWEEIDLTSPLKAVEGCTETTRINESHSV